MQKIAIRFSKMLFVTAMFGIGCSSALAYGQTSFVRISAADFGKDPQKVAALQKAVATMRANDTKSNTSADYRASWAYWAATHGYFGQGPNASGSAADFIAQAPGICSGLPQKLYNTCLTYYPHVTDMTPPSDGFTSTVWGTCQHSDPSQGPSQANLQFLTWHRMYLHYFERVLRKSSGDPNFTLPYWDYASEKGPNNGYAIPTIVRGASTKALYDQFRTPGLNDNTGSINPNSASATQAFKFNDFQNFSFQLEMQPHGAMHCATGFGCQAPDMGIVPVAGLDPVFYMHHANIDRLWQCWMVKKAAGQPITLAWAKANLGMPDSWFSQTFDFADENGNKATLSVQDLFTPGTIDYTYDKETNCVPGTVLAQAAPLTKVSPVSSKATTSLKGQAQSIELAPSAGLEAPSLGEVRPEPGKVLLIIQDIQIKGSPGVTYDIYVHKKGAPEKSVYVATLNYFGVHGPHHGGHPNPKRIKTLFYDVGSELAQLGIPEGDGSQVAVRFVPTSGSSLAASVSDKAGSVEVGSIRLQSTSSASGGASPLPSGKWTYRSFINQPVFVAGDANKALSLIFAEATMSLDPPSPTNDIRGVLDMGGGYFLDLSGKWIPAQSGYPATAQIAGKGRAGTPTANWEYDYQAFVVPNWPNGVDQRPAFVGSVIRAKPHDGAPAGYTASFVAVRQP